MTKQPCSVEQPLQPEMICGELNPISGGRNELFIGYRKRGKSFTEGENKGEIKCPLRVVLRPVPSALFKVKKKKRKEQRRQASPATNDSRHSSMIKQPRSS